MKRVDSESSEDALGQHLQTLWSLPDNDEPENYWLKMPLARFVQAQAAIILVAIDADRPDSRRLEKLAKGRDRAIGAGRVGIQVRDQT